MTIPLMLPAKVAPFMGAWIETTSSNSSNKSAPVAPFMGAWIETLSSVLSSTNSIVAPFMGAWIETNSTRVVSVPMAVAPFMGAWIETWHRPATSWANSSHPSWVRGLKPARTVGDVVEHQVAPFMGAWIETKSLPLYHHLLACRTLHGCVD